MVALLLAGGMASADHGAAGGRWGGARWAERIAEVGPGEGAGPPVGEADAGPRDRAGEHAVTDTADAPLTGADSAGTWLVLSPATGMVEPPCAETGACRPVLFVRPSDCTPKSRWYYERRTQRCEAESRLVLFVDRAGEIHGAQRLGDQPAGNEPVPDEVRHLWRHCGEDAEPRWDPMPVTFIRYVDPDLGRCLVAHPDAKELSVDVSKKARVKGLDTLHPFVRYAGRELVRRAYEEGIEIKVISGHRHYKARVGYDRNLKRRRVLASWHAFGVALDINMTWARGLVEASRRRRDDPAEHARWERLGEIGRELGLRWGGDMKSDDIFHFEWHPGYGGRLQPRELAAFLRATGGGKHYEKSWHLFGPGARKIVAATKLPPPPKVTKPRKGAKGSGKAVKGGKDPPGRAPGGEGALRSKAKGGKSAVGGAGERPKKGAAKRGGKAGVKGAKGARGQRKSGKAASKEPRGGRKRGAR